MSIMPTPGLCRPRRGSPCRATVQGWSGRHNPGAWLTLPSPIAGEGGQDVQAEEQGHHRSVGGAARAVCATVHVAAGRGWLLAKIDQEVPADLDVHLICDNYSTHKSPVVKTWLAAHPRFQMHFTPTYSSWLNQVARLFAFVTEDLLQRRQHDTTVGPAANPEAEITTPQALSRRSSHPRNPRGKSRLGDPPGAPAVMSLSVFAARASRREKRQTCHSKSSAGSKCCMTFDDSAREWSRTDRSAGSSRYALIGPTPPTSSSSHRRGAREPPLCWPA